MKVRVHKLLTALQQTTGQATMCRRLTQFVGKLSAVNEIIGRSPGSREPMWRSFSEKTLQLHHLLGCRYSNFSGFSTLFTLDGKTPLICSRLRESSGGRGMVFLTASVFVITIIFHVSPHFLYVTSGTCIQPAHARQCAVPSIHMIHTHKDLQNYVEYDYTVAFAVSSTIAS